MVFQDYVRSICFPKTFGALGWSGKRKPWNQRSEKRKADKRGKHMAQAKERAQKEGKVWVEKSHAQHKKEKRRAMLVVTILEAALELEQRPPLEIIQRNFDELGRCRMTCDEHIERMRFVDSLFAQQFAAQPKYESSIARAHANMLKEIGIDEFHCLLCDKKVWGGRWASQDGHCLSELHKLRVWEQAAGDEMVGPACSPRRFSSSPGLTGPLL
jgi:hypothetical protein